MYVGVEEEEEEESYEWVKCMSIIVSYVGIYIKDVFVHNTYGISKVWVYNTLIT